MKNLCVIKRLYLSVLFVLLGFCQMYGWDSDVYYAKATAKVNPTGAGTVYVESNVEKGATGEESTGIGTTETSGGNVSFTFVATPKGTHDFKGWSEINDVNTSSFVTTNNPYTRNYTASNKANDEGAATTNTLYAIFAEKPLFYFSATAEVRPTEFGTASSNPTKVEARSEKWNSTTATTNAITFTAEPKSDDYDFQGWSRTENGDIVSTENPYKPTLTSNSTSSNSPTSTTLYARFAEKPIFAFNATAVVTPAGAGTATVDPATTSVRGDKWNSTSATTNEFVFSATPASNYTFLGWSKTADGEIESTASPYNPTLTSNNPDASVNTTLYARFQIYPTGITATPASIVLGVGESSNISVNLNPQGSYKKITFESNNSSIATVDANGVVTAGSTSGSTTITIKALKSDGVTVLATTTVAVSVLNFCSTPEIIIDPSFDGKTATVTLNSATANATIYYTIDGGNPTTASMPYSSAFTINNGQTVKAIAVKDGLLDSKMAVALYSAEKVAAPTITITTSGVTFGSDTPDATFYYTTNGDDPSISLSPWNGTPITGLSEGVTIKVIAVKSGMIPSDMATKLYFPTSNANGTTVILNDLEDHNWTYYSGVDRAVDGGNYNDNYVGKLYSPNPRNVKITYNANGGAVSIDESETSFVYFKTLEQGATAGQYPYTVISNPFSKRPTGKGFGGWKIISGGEYINGYNNGSTLPLDQEITFVNLPYPSVNCISAEIVFEATWVNFNNITRSNGNNITYNITGGTYETNILVLTGNTSATIAPNCSVTIMMVEPDGSNDYRTNSFTGSITPYNGGVTKIEFAHWTPGSTVDARGRNFTIGRGMIMDGTRRALYGTNQREAMNQILKVESGNFSTFTSYNNNPTSITKHWVVFGCDYDRAKKDNNKLTFTGKFITGEGRTLGLSSKGEMARVWSKSGSFMTGVQVDDAAADNSYYVGVTSNHNNGHRYLEIQGGEWYANIAGGMGENHTATDPGFTFRMKGGIIRGSVYGAAAFAGAGGIRTYVITGGTIGGWVAGGANGTQADGGLLDGTTYIYVGGKARVDSKGSTSVINRAVGGNVFGAGCGNGTDSNSGEISLGTNVVVADETYIERGVYGGGSYGFTEATSNLYITGGRIGGVAGGVNGTLYSANIPGGVYGGACQNRGGTVNIYMTGGEVNGGLYGGSNNSGTIANNVTMQINGGQVGTSSASANIHGGGYGQSTIVSGNVEVTLGTAGQSTGGVTVYGDVYGGSALGKVNTNTNDTTKVNLIGGIIHGDAYGGGLGASGIAADVNGNVTVTLNGTAFVLATTTDDKGNTIPTSGRVFGCNNINGSPKGTVLVKVLQTVARNSDGTIKDKPTTKNSGIYELQAVYGGGNLAAYYPTDSKATGQYTYSFNSETYGEVNFTAVEKPVQVVIDGCGFTSIEYVYGGGNAAPTPATDVIVLGSYEIGNVFGGGNGKDRYTLDGGNTWNENPGADVGIIDAVAYQQNTANGKYGTGMSKASVLGGTVHNLFGASNTKGNVVTESLAYVDNANICDLNVGGIYGGGNEAYMDGDSKIKLGCIEALEEIYGGARNANVKGDIDLTISSGHFDRVFGGNNIGGTINGSITVTIKETGCKPITIGELYGCGNQAPYTTPEGENHPTINLKSFTSIGNVFGGGLGASAVVTGNPTVNINVEDGAHVNVEYKEKTIEFGNDYKVTLPLHKAGEIGAIGTVYGGGNAAAVIGNTTVNMTNGIVENTVFGGGNAADVEGSTSVTILDGTIGGNVYGGGNQGNVAGATKVQIGQ